MEQPHHPACWSLCFASWVTLLRSVCSFLLVRLWRMHKITAKSEAMEAVSTPHLNLIKVEKHISWECNSHVGSRDREKNLYFQKTNENVDTGIWNKSRKCWKNSDSQLKPLGEETTEHFGSRTFFSTGIKMEGIIRFPKQTWRGEWLCKTKDNTENG